MLLSIRFSISILSRIFVLLLLCIFLIPISAATIDTVAGNGNPADGGVAGAAKTLNIGEPFGVEIGPDGALYICEVRNHRVRRLDLQSGQVTTVAGTGKKGYSGDGGLATQAELNEPYEVRFDATGNLYFVEMKNHVVRKVAAQTGIISTLAGTGKEGFSGDGGPATAATFRQPHSIALDVEGNVYVADILNHRIRRISAKTGLIETIAGNGDKKLPVENALAQDQPVLGPRSLCVSGQNLWVCLREGNSVWKLDLSSGKWQHIAGTGKQGFTGDGGPAKTATFNGPKGIAMGPDNALYVVDTESQAIRRIDLATHTIATFAGAGPAFKGDLGDGGEATNARLARPHGVCVGPTGTVYIGDSENHRVRRVTPHSK